MIAEQLNEKFNQAEQDDVSFPCKTIIFQFEQMAKVHTKKCHRFIVMKQKALDENDLNYLEQEGFIVEKIKTFSHQVSEEEGPIYTEDQEYKISLK